MAKLIVKFKEKTLKEIEVNKNSAITIGRDPSNSLHLENAAVSRFHAKIYKQGWAYYVEDLKSTNGTGLNGKKINWKAALSNKDKITIGKHTLTFFDRKMDYEDDLKFKNLDRDQTIRFTKKDK